MTVELHAIAQYSTLRIVESLAEGTGIGIFAALLLRFAPRQNAGARFAIWFSALIAIAALPFVGALSVRAGVSTGIINRAAITLPDSWALYLFIAWSLIAFWLLCGVGHALWRLHVLRRNCTPVDVASLDPVLQDTLRGSLIKRKSVVCTSEQVRIPTALGLMKPAIVIPAWAMRELSTAELNQIFLHELAHLCRWDDWTNLAQQVVKAIFFFHPAVWWIENKAALEREIACDDAVLAATDSPRAYAECLAHLAERSFLQRSVALAQAAIGRIRQTSSRVAQILDVNRPQSNGSSWKPAVSLIAGFAIAAGVAASRAPRLIAFEDSRRALVADSGAAKQPTFDVTPSQEFPQTVPITQAKLIAKPSQPNGKAQKHPATAAPPVILRPKAGSLFHLARVASGSIPVTETLFVVIQSSNQSVLDQPLYQIQMWRVTLLRYVPEPASTKTPPRKT